MKQTKGSGCFTVKLTQTQTSRLLKFCFPLEVQGEIGFPLFKSHYTFLVCVSPNNQGGFVIFLYKKSIKTIQAKKQYNGQVKVFLKLGNTGLH